MKYLFTYQLYYTKNGQKKVVDAEDLNYIEFTIKKENISQYLIEKNGEVFKDTRINPFKSKEGLQC